MRSLTLGALSLVFLAGCSHSPAQATELETNQQKASYAAGMMLGERVANTLSVNDLDEDLFLQALRDRIKGNDMRLSKEAATEASNAYQGEITARIEKEKKKEIARNASEGQAFLKKNKQRPEVESLPSGLQYEVLKEANGGASPGPGDAVRVHYSGTLLDGSFVESSLAHGEAVRVNMGVTIPGWQQALTRMKEGEKWRLFLPPELAYGEKGRGEEVPPQSTLIYDLELVEVIEKS
jgi:FKBP-type peptidyl-prolyl cis-trans isomerase FklB